MKIYGKNKIKKHIIGESPVGAHLRQLPIITVEGMETMLVTGCLNILVYTCERVRLRLCDMTLTVNGSQLTMKTYFGDRIMISGEFDSIEFEV